MLFAPNEEIKLNSYNLLLALCKNESNYDQFNKTTQSYKISLAYFVIFLIDLELFFTEK
jgi:hypothetical protein